MVIQVVNLEQGMPAAAVAMQRMKQALRTARVSRTPAVKLIHGYGSTGRGGAICAEARRELAELQRQGSIRLFVPGEEFSPFYADARRALDLVPQLARDSDYSRTNQGVTIVIL